MNHRFRVELKDETGSRSGSKSEDPQRSGWEERGECAEYIEVGVGEGAEEEGDTMYVPGGVEEEESGAGQGVVGVPGDMQDPNVVVAGLEVHEDFYVFRRNAAVALLFGGHWAAAAGGGGLEFPN